MHGPPEQAAAQLISRLQAAGVFDAQGNLTDHPVSVPRHSDLADKIQKILEKAHVQISRTNQSYTRLLWPPCF